MKDKVCWKCNKLYTPNAYNQKYCGSRRKKKGCSYKVYREDNKKYLKLWSKKNPAKIKAYAKKNNARKTKLGYWKTDEFRKKQNVRKRKYRLKLKFTPSKNLTL